MLSKVAERIYWMCRYLERAENTARLVSVYSELLLDLPTEAGVGWSLPLQVLGLGDAYHGKNKEQQALEFLLSGSGNPASLLASLGQARENARTTRDTMPSEAWQAINEMHLMAERRLGSVARRENFAVLSEIVGNCHEINGIFEGGMSHGAAYQFVRLGRSLERADMTSRMIDVAAAVMLTAEDDVQPYSNTIWRGVLRALSAYQMYRQYVRRRITAPDVVRFLLLDGEFPRAIGHCALQFEAAAVALPNSGPVLDGVAELKAHLAEIDVQQLDHDLLHRLVDELQIEFARLDRRIFATWLDPVRPA